ncbi:hypothetical protein OAQ08_02060 [Alphaproteobacteria bacterium]|nr:hypothetical protein [Alphaproteobacteria bacterium]
MLKTRFYKIILMAPLLVSILIFFQIENQDAYQVQSMANADISFKYPNETILISYLPKLDMLNSDQKYLLNLNTCLQISNSDNCLIIESEIIFNSLVNCQNEGEKVFLDTFDLRLSGTIIEYVCKKLSNDMYANLRNFNNNI